MKYGYGQMLDQMRLWEQLNIERRIFHRKGRRYEHLTTAQRVPLALEELGPTFIKLGQVLSTRPDLVPQEYIRELEKLQNRVAPFHSQIARDVAQTELGRPLDQVFGSFEDEPIAAASLSQVHRATLMNGKEVIVKIQRPRIVKQIEGDLEIMLSLATLMERYVEDARLFNPVGIVREFSANMKRELNFRTEANNVSRFANNFAGDPQIHVPEIYPELCTPRILVMEYIQGINVSEIERLIAEGYDLPLIARRGVDISFKSTIEHGFFHADPHPGNTFILPGNVICMLDFGMMGTLSNRERDSLSKVAYNLVKRDEKGTTRALLEVTEAQSSVNTESLERDVSNLIRDYAYMPLRDISLGDLLRQLQQLIRTHRLRIPKNMIWLLKSAATTEDVMRKLDPTINLIEHGTPYAQRLVRRRFNPLSQARSLSFAAMDFLELAKEWPNDAKDILQQLKTGRIKIEFEHVGLESTRRTVRRSSNHIAIAIVIAALLVGASLIVHAGLSPSVSGIPVIGLTGYIIAGVLGIWLIVSMLRSGGT